MNSFNEESLRKLTYSELKKQAKDNGIKVNMTADKIIASLLEKSNADEDSFVTLERNILNSCNKNKIAFFNAESKRMSETPRRDTYTVDTPLINVQAIDNSFIMASASPDFKQTKDESLNVTISRGSEKKNRKSKRKVSFVTPLRRSNRLSIATPQYNSVKGRVKTPMPSRLSSAKKRLSVTKEGNDSIICNLNLDISENVDTKKISVGKAKRPSTPMPPSKQKKRLSSSRKIKSSPRVLLHRLKEEDLKDFLIANDKKIEVTPVQFSKKVAALSTENKDAVAPLQSNKVAALTPGFKKIVTPFSMASKSKSACSTPKNHERTPRPQSSKATLTPGFKKVVTPFSSSKRATPRSEVKPKLTPEVTAGPVRKSPRSNVKSAATTKLTSSAVKKTPNFKKLHQKAFDKMESISDYKQRKLVNSQKKKEEQNRFLNMAKSNVVKQKKVLMDKKVKKGQKTFGGIPFVSSAAITKPLQTNKLGSDLKTVSSLQSKRANDKSLAKKVVAGNVKAMKSVSRENAPLKQRHKFDLQASLAKKLSYKPHTGPLKPLNENLNSTIANASMLPTKKVETKNVVLTKARAQAREVLHGVRKNKRFLLQMNNRNLDISKQ